MVSTDREDDCQAAGTQTMCRICSKSTKNSPGNIPGKHVVVSLLLETSEPVQTF